LKKAAGGEFPKNISSKIFGEERLSTRGPKTRTEIKISRKSLTNGNGIWNKTEILNRGKLYLIGPPEKGPRRCVVPGGGLERNTLQKAKAVGGETSKKESIKKPSGGLNEKRNLKSGGSRST